MALSQTHEDRQGLMGQMETHICTSDKCPVGALGSTAWQRSPPSDRLYVSYLCVCLVGVGYMPCYTLCPTSLLVTAGNTLYENSYW